MRRPDPLFRESDGPGLRLLQRSVERPLSAYLIVLVALAASPLVAAGLPAADLAGLAVLALLLVAIAARTFRDGLSQAAVAAFAVVCLLLLAGSARSPGYLAAWTILVGGVMVAICLSWQEGAARLIGLGYLGCSLGVGVAAGHGAPTLDLVMLEVGVLIAGTVIMATLIAGTRLLDDVAARQAGQRVARQGEQSAARAMARARRVLHASVNTLESIAGLHPAAGHDDAAIRAAAGRTVARMRAAGERLPRRAVPAHEVPDLIAAASPVPVRVRTDALGGLLLPEVVAEAFGDAAGEVVRNAIKHAAARSMDLAASGRDGGLRLVLRDRGTGWRDGSGQGPASSTGEGLAEIVRTMELIGGEAAYGVAPDGGAQVTLSWRPAPELPAQIAVLEELLGHRLLRSLAVAACLVYGYLFWRHPPSTGAVPWVEAGALVVLCLSVCWVGRGPVRTMTGVAAVGWTVWFLALVAVVFAVQESGTATGPRSWQVGVAGSGLLILAIRCPWRWVLPLSGAFGLVLAVVLVVDDVAPVAAIPCLLQPLLVLLGGLVSRRVQVAHRGLEAWHEEVAAQAAADREAAVMRDAERLYLERAALAYAPLLASVAEGTADPQGSLTRQRAARLVAEARDDLAWPGLFDTRLRESAADFRARGGQLEMRPAWQHRAPSGLTREIVRAGLTAALPGSRVTFSPGAAGAASRLALVPPPPLASWTSVWADDEVVTVRASPRLLRIEFVETGRTAGDSGGPELVEEES